MIFAAMTTHTIFGTCLLIIGLSTAGFSQNYHTAFHSMRQLNTMLDSLETPHLRVSVDQPDKSVMKFRVFLSNPNSRRATISIRKKNDIYLYETISGREFATMYDFEQLEDGDYEVIVTGGREKVSTNISIHTETQVSREAVVH
jgi:outer membrane lipoprotein-sorting protein